MSRLQPRDMTSGCTGESQDPRDLAGALRAAGAQFVGVLLDGAARLLQEWRKVKVPGHAEAVLEAAQRQRSRSHGRLG